MIREVGRRLLDWYAHKGRALPWREVRDPYAIWVAEIMLQQTQVDTVIPYYLRWMERFPTITALADANQQQVLKLWEGLGYYGRARNLHRAAQVVVEKYNGQIPNRRAELENLPGIGAYTAGAIASIAYGQDDIALDGNLRRVLARIFNIDASVGSPQAERRFGEVWRENLPHGQAGDYNQALMDLGATICTPRGPSCSQCPVSEICIARQLDIQDRRPVTKKRAAVPHYIVTAAVIRRNGEVLITRRPSNGLLGGLWEFPGGKQEPGEDLHACLKREIEEELAVQILVGEKIGVFRHAYTHFKVTLHAFECQLSSGEPQAVQVDGICWVTPPQLHEFPMGKIDRQIAAQISAATHK